MRYWFCPHVVKNIVSVAKLVEILVLATFGGVVKNLVSAAKLVEILVLPTFLQVVKNVVSAEKLVEIPFSANILVGGQKHRLSRKIR